MNEGLTGLERHEGELLMTEFSFFGVNYPFKITNAYMILWISINFFLQIVKKTFFFSSLGICQIFNFRINEVWQN